MARNEDTTDALDAIARRIELAATRASAAVRRLREKQLPSILANGTKQADASANYLLHWSQNLVSDVNGSIEADELGIPFQPAIDKKKNTNRAKHGRKKQDGPEDQGNGRKEGAA